MQSRKLKYKMNMEKQFDINKVIAYYKLDPQDLAKVLFPFVKYQKQALERIIKGEAELNVTQIEKLANYIGVLVTDLFSIDTWKSATEDNCLTMLKGDYKVKLNYNGVYVSIYKNNELIYQELANMPGMTINEFIDFLNNFIKNYENGNN